MSSINRVVISGNLGNDPVVRNFGENGIVAEMSVAVQDRMKRTMWWDIKCYSPQSIERFIKPYLKKGMLICVDGRIGKDVYEKDGMKQSRSYIIADDIAIMSSVNNKQDVESGNNNDDVSEPDTMPISNRASDSSVSNKKSNNKKEEDILIDDEIPF